MTTRDMKTRVQRGAKLLDKEDPGWENRVKITPLDLGSPCKCVLGQLFAATAEFNRAGSGYELVTTEMYYPGDVRREPSKRFAIAQAVAKVMRKTIDRWSHEDWWYGFDVDDSTDDETYAELTDLWREEIRARWARKL